MGNFAIPGTGTLSSSSGSYVKSTYGFGGSLIPGVYLTDHTLGYARLGVVDSHFKGEEDGVFGGQVGLGMQTDVGKNLSLRGEYVFTAYRSFNGNSSPKSDQFNVGIVYKFI